MKALSDLDKNLAAAKFALSAEGYVFSDHPTNVGYLVISDPVQSSRDGLSFERRTVLCYDVARFLSVRH